MEKALVQQTLKQKLRTGVKPAIEFLYTSYSPLLYGYILQFIPDKKEAEKILIDVFCNLPGRLQEASESSLSIYCWLQVETRKIILAYKKSMLNVDAHGESFRFTIQKPYYFFSLLQEATEDQHLVFREIFLNGTNKEELAKRINKDVEEINRLLKESLVLIRIKLL